MPRYWSWGKNNSRSNAPALEWGKEYNVSITDKSRKGDGIAKLEGYTVFVKDGLIGQTARVRITSLGNMFATAEIVQAVQSTGAQSSGDLSASQFEEVIGRLFEATGYSVENLPDVGDYGADLIARKASDTIVLQCKRYAEGNLVGVTAIRETLGSMWKYKANKSILITTSFFTVQAEEQAKEAPIELWDKNDLNEMLEKYHMTFELLDKANLEQRTGYDDVMKEIEGLREYLPVDAIDSLKAKFLQGDHKSLRKELAEIKKGVSEKSFNEWAILIKNEACTTCKINEADLTLDGKLIKEGVIDLKFRLENYEQKMPCVVDVIKQNINRMPPLTRLYFEQLLSSIRQKYGIS